MPDYKSEIHQLDSKIALQIRLKRMHRNARSSCSYTRCYFLENLMYRLQIEYRESEFLREFGESPSREIIIQHLRQAHFIGCSEMHITVCAGYDYDGAKIELALIEARRLQHDEWVLQYLSQPPGTNGFTGGILPNDTDFIAYISGFHINTAHPFRPFSAEALHAEGLGPVDRLNLRPGNLVPILPSNVDLARFKALVELS